jgi:hypothetical protein
MFSVHLLSDDAVAPVECPKIMPSLIWNIQRKTRRSSCAVAGSRQARRPGTERSASGLAQVSRRCGGSLEAFDIAAHHVAWLFAIRAQAVVLIAHALDATRGRCCDRARRLCADAASVGASQTCRDRGEHGARREGRRAAPDAHRDRGREDRRHRSERRAGRLRPARVDGIAWLDRCTRPPDLDLWQGRQEPEWRRDDNGRRLSDRCECVGEPHGRKRSLRRTRKAYRSFAT